MNRLPAWLGRIVYWLIWPGTWLYLRWSVRTRVIIAYRNEIMVIRPWLGPGKWHLPGGGLNEDELPEKGAVRELYEETGLTLHEAEVNLLATEAFEHGGFRYTCHYSAYRAASRPVVRAKFPEVIDVAWLDRSAVDGGNCAPEVLRALELLEASGR